MISNFRFQTIDNLNIEHRLMINDLRSNEMNVKTNFDLNFEQ